MGRSMTVALCAAISLFAACGDDSSAVDMGQDLSATTQTCGQVVMCAQACNGVESCAMACAAKGSSSAMTKYQALLTCAYGQCIACDTIDGGTCTPKCASTTDTSMTCAGCLGTAAASSACGTQLSACLADK